jgi:hypothetical protein
LKDEIAPYFLQVPDLELARLRQTEADLESLAKYRRLKLEAYQSWSASMGKEFTYYNAKGELEKIDVEAKRAEAAATQDSFAGKEIGPQYSVRKAYRDHLSDPSHAIEGWCKEFASLPGIDRRGKLNSPLKWTPIPPPIDLSRWEKVCLWFQKSIKELSIWKNSK